MILNHFFKFSVGSRDEIVRLWIKTIQVFRVLFLFNALVSGSCWLQNKRRTKMESSQLEREPTDWLTNWLKKTRDYWRAQATLISSFTQMTKGDEWRARLTAKNRFAWNESSNSIWITTSCAYFRSIDRTDLPIIDSIGKISFKLMPLFDKRESKRAGGCEIRD